MRAAERDQRNARWVFYKTMNDSDPSLQLPLMAWKFSGLDPNPSLIPLDLPIEVDNLDKSTAWIPGGAYTTLRTYQTSKALRLADHLHRLEQTAALAGKPLPVAKDGLRSALRQAIRRYQEQDISASKLDLRLRLTLDLEKFPGDAYIAVERLMLPPPDAYQVGVKVIPCQMERWLPEAKLTRFIDRSRAVRRSLPEEANEALMVSPDGTITEGLSSNFFGVRLGQIHTAGEKVLSGVTRAITLDCITRLRLSFTLSPIRLDEVPLLEEAFITSSSRGVLPVRQIDEISIGARAPGPITTRLMQAYESAVQEQLEPI